MARRTSARARVASRCLAIALAALVAAPAALVAPGAPARAEDAADGSSGAAATLSADEPPELSSPSAFLVEPTTGTVLLDKDADARREPASTTKVMTALVVLEHASLDDEVTVEQSDFDEVTPDSSVAGLVAGETLSVRDLLACMLLPSGNDASYVLARAVAGDWRSFVDLMNEKAAELGCAGTHFANPCGLHDDDHYTCARDLATIFSAAMEHPEFAQIAGSLTWDLPATSGNPARTLESTDLLIDPESPVYMDGAVTAGKTGYTGDAGRCLVVAGERDGVSLVGAVLGAGDEVDAQGVTANFTDMRAMLEWGFGAWQTGAVVSAGDVVASAGVTLSTDGDAVDAAATDAVVATVPRGTTLADLTVTPTWEGAEGTGADGGPAFQAPLEEGEALGTVSLSLDGRELGGTGVVATRAMGLSIPAFVLRWLSDPVHAVIAVAVAVAVFVAIGLLATWSSRRRRPQRYRMAVGQRRAVRPGVGSQHLRMPDERPGRRRR